MAQSNLAVRRLPVGVVRARRVAIALTIGIAGGILASNLSILPEVRNHWGEDDGFFVRAAEHWQATGSFYLGHQLAGPYEATTAVDVLYPPPAIALFLPFLYLPAFLWWAIPLGTIASLVIRHRPAWWSWPVLALLAAQLPFLSSWGDYLTVMRNNLGSWPPPWYSLADYLFIAIPIVAWYARTRDRGPRTEGAR